MRAYAPKVFGPLLFLILLSGSGIHSSYAFESPECTLDIAPATLHAPYPEESLRTVGLRPEFTNKADKDWNSLGKELIHRLVGDDIEAYLGFYPKLDIIGGPNPGAFAESPNRLIVSSGLLDLIETSSQYAFVLAHELAHIMLGHGGHDESAHKRPASFQEQLALHIKHEIEADRLALKLLGEARFDIRDVGPLLRRLSDFGKEYGTPLDSVHPSLKPRRNAIRTYLDSAPTRGEPVLLSRASS